MGCSGHMWPPQSRSFALGYPCHSHSLVMPGFQLKHSIRPALKYVTHQFWLGHSSCAAKGIGDYAWLGSQEWDQRESGMYWQMAMVILQKQILTSVKNFTQWEFWPDSRTTSLFDVCIFIGETKSWDDSALRPYTLYSLYNLWRKACQRQENNSAHFMPIEVSHQQGSWWQGFSDLTKI